MRKTRAGIIVVLAAAARLLVASEAALAQCCDDCNGDGQVTVDEIITSVNRALNGCVDDAICSQFAEQRLRGTGQTTSYGPGSDGAVGAGAALSYTDNGDGTITDNRTGLVWEKKDQSGGIHDWSNTYTWGMTSAPFTMSGTMVTTFLATLNAGAGFAGHTDWRIPNVNELQSIAHYGISDPAVDAVFNTNCAAGCTVLTCSCTRSDGHWSSTTGQSIPDFAWFVNFNVGYVFTTSKSLNAYVRAVRGGL